MKLIKMLCAVFAVFALATSAHAQNAPNKIEAVNVAKQGGDVTVKVDFSDPLSALPTGFSVAKPAKIAFDFLSTANGLGSNSKNVNQGDLQSLNVVQVGDRTRLVLNLTRNMNFTTRLDGKSMYVTLAQISNGDDALANRASRFAEKSAITGRHSIQDILFRRGKDGEGRIVVELSDSGAGIDIRQQGTDLVVDFVKTSVPEHLRRKLDVNDFATPVNGIETRVQGDNVRMTISPRGLWEHNAYQSENQFVVEVKKIIEDPNKLVQSSKIGYQGPKMSINYQGEVRPMLKLLAEELNLNAVFGANVQGQLALNLMDVPVDQAMDVIFKIHDLDMRKNGNVIMIDKRADLVAREKLEFEAKQQTTDLEPLRMEQYALNYQKAVDVARLLAGGVAGGAAGGAAPAPAQGGGAAANTSQRILSKRGSAVADPSSNLLFVNDVPTKLEEIRAFIKAIDISARQVLIEARVVEANDSFNKDLGMKLNFLSGGKTTLGGGVQMGGGVYSPTGQTNNSMVNVNLPSYNTNGGAFTFSLFNASLSRILNLELAALETDGIGKIISSPRLITANNVKAKIEDGTEIPIVTPGSANSAATVTFKSAKLSLEVTPQITPEGTVKMQLSVKKEEPDWTRAVQGNPPIKSSVVETNVVVENGGTVVVGGVYITTNSSSTEKVPFFGDIPFLGWAFKYKNDIGSRRELLVFITPRVISENMRLE